MFSEGNDRLAKQAGKHALLRSEIRFWRELIDSPGVNAQPRESVERMHQALALAEYRLAELDRQCGSH